MDKKNELVSEIWWLFEHFFLEIFFAVLDTYSINLFLFFTIRSCDKYFWFKLCGFKRYSCQVIFYQMYVQKLFKRLVHQFKNWSYFFSWTQNAEKYAHYPESWGKTPSICYRWWKHHLKSALFFLTAEFSLKKTREKNKNPFYASFSRCVFI